jgi:hypothetical protein
MAMKVKIRCAATALIFLGYPLLCGAQTSKGTLEIYVSKSVAEADSLDIPTIKEWSARHPGEVVEGPPSTGSDNDAANAWKLSPRQLQDMKLEGRWCLRSTAEVDLEGGIHVQRVALFYQPLIEDVYGKPLPPLPEETGDVLRNHGCRLVKIFHEFRGVPDPQNFAESIGKQMPGKRAEKPGGFIEFARDGYWKPVCSFEKFGHPISYNYLLVRDPKLASADDQPAVLLEWQRGTLEYGQPSSTKIDPEAAQPWLALRAAKFAGLPTAETLDMLSFLAPQVGDTYEQRPFHCGRQLIPILRKWLELADKIEPERHSAAILVADRVLSRLWYCEEFLRTEPYASPEEEAAADKDHDALEQDLKEMGIGTTSGRLGFEYYSGNLLQKALQLAPEGAANELAQKAILDERCHWDGNSDSADCDKIIKEGETFLTRFPEDEWTPSVHLILAEAYALTASNSEEEISPTPPERKAEWQKKAAAHYRAWYIKSMNERDRALVWQEIWALEAGMGPWLLTPFQFAAAPN